MANNTYDVAIVGGGAIGWSCAWHLLKRNPSLAVVVIDPDPTRCTSLRGAGGSRAQFTTEVNIKLSLASIEEFKWFPNALGESISYQQNGYLLYTADPSRAEKMKRAAEFQRSHGAAVEELSIDDLQKRVHCLNTSDLVYAHIGTQDGYMDGPIVRHCYRDSAMKMGATELAAKATAVTRNSVETERDSVSAEHVVLATGHWSGGMGLDLPVLPEKHQLYFASVGEIDPKWPFVIDADTTYHFRPHGDQIIICYNDEELASEIHGVDENPEFDYKVLDRLLPIVEHRTPGLIERESIELGRAGYYGVTPDHHPILGRKDGVIVATGFGGHGVMHSPAAGKLVTEMVLDGEANSVDVACLSPNRFQTGQLIQETMVF